MALNANGFAIGKHITTIGVDMMVVNIPMSPDLGQATLAMPVARTVALATPPRPSEGRILNSFRECHNLIPLYDIIVYFSTLLLPSQG